MTDEQREALLTVDTLDLINELKARNTHTLVVLMKDFDAGADEVKYRVDWSGGAFTALGMAHHAQLKINRDLLDESEDCEEEDA